MACQEPVGSAEQSPTFQLRQEHPSLGPCDVTVMGVASSHGKRSPCSRGSRENSHDGRDLRRMVVLELVGVPGSASRHPLEDVLKPSLGTVRVLENKTTAIGGNITKREQDLEQAQDTLASAEANIGKPFVDADALEAARDRAADLAAQLAESTSEEDEPTAAADGAHPQTERPQTRVQTSAPARYAVEASEPAQITREGRERLTDALEKLRAKNERATEPERRRSRFEPHHDAPASEDRAGPGRSL